MSINFNSNRVRLAAVAITLIILVFFNVSRRQDKPKIESDFEIWMGAVQLKLNDPLAEVAWPRVVMQIVQPGDGVTRFEFPSAKTEIPSAPQVSLGSDVPLPTPAPALVKAAVKRRDQVVRILQLVEESGVLGLPQSHLDNPEGAVHLQISDGDREFSSVFSLRDAEANIRVQNLVRLLKEYSAPAHRQGGKRAQS